MNKRHLLITLKLLFSAIILYWLIQSERLSFSLLKDVIKHSKAIFFATLLQIAIFIIISYRYALIIKIKSENINFSSILKFNWIAQFFNAILPGSVTGDITKVFYLRNQDRSLSTSFLFGSIIIDRFIGLCGLITGLGIFSLINYENLLSLPKNISIILNTNFILILVIFFLLILFMKINKSPSILINNFLGTDLSFSFFEKIDLMWLSLQDIKNKLFLLIILSTISQLLAVIAFWIVTSPFSHSSFDLSIAFFLVPIGFLSLALPISPSGLGIGHAVFHSLFLLIGIQNGASLFNIYFLVLLLTNLTGVIPYLFLKKQY